MKRARHHEKKSRGGLILIPVIIAMTVAIAVLIFFLVRGCDSTPPLPEENESAVTSTVSQNPDSIAVPGYEALQLKADSKEQLLTLPNPAQNMCYFQIALYLEDGTLLWQSELIPPGEVSKPIQLTQTLAKGTYQNAVLRYSCFSMNEEKTPLNGAETKLALWVK